MSERELPSPPPTAIRKPAPPPVLPSVGDEVGPYRLLRLLDEGPNGRVFDVEHVSIGRRAAMKVLSPEHLAKPGALSRMVDGAKALNRIGHPNIVEIIDIVEVTGPNPALAVVMELLEGRTLASLLTESERPGPDVYVPIMIQVADALCAAHAAHFIHRNLKPANVMLVERGRAREYVKLLGFGIAKSLLVDGEPGADGARPAAYATVEGTFIGTPAYASPEQAVGKSVDHRTDVYSLGVILFELVHGRLPFLGGSIGEYLYQHLSAPVPPASKQIVADPVLRTIDALARRCLSKARAERPASAAEVRDLLEALSQGNPAVISPPPPPERRGYRNVVVASVLVGIACVAGLGAMAVARWFGRASSPSLCAPGGSCEQTASGDPMRSSQPAP